MSALDRRSTIALLLAASIVVGTLVVGGAAGQTATEPEANETATPTDAADETATPAETETMTETETETETGTAADRPFGQDTAYHRVAHVSPDAPPVDVFVDGERVLANVSFGDVSEYVALPAGDHTVRIATASENATAGENATTVFEGNVTLEPRSVTTLFAAGEVGENATMPFSPILFEDDPLRPAEGESAVSVAHMSPDAPAVDVTAENGSVVIAENVSFAEASQYVTVPAGDYTLEIRSATESNDGPIVATADVSLEGGTAYSAIALGYADANASADGEALRVELVEDASKTIHLPSEDVEADGNETDAETPTTGAGGEETTEVIGEGTTESNETATEVPTETVEG